MILVGCQITFWAWSSRNYTARTGSARPSFSPVAAGWMSRA